MNLNLLDDVGLSYLRSKIDETYVKKTVFDAFANVTGIVKGNGLGTASAATANDVVTLLDSTPVNRATADVDGNAIKTTYAKKTDLDDKQDEHVTATCSLTVAGWSSNAQTVSVTGVTASNTVIVAPAPASAAAWAAAGVLCTAQAAGSLTFSCTTAPTEALTANVLILG